MEISSGKINCSLISKDLLFAGEKGLYLDFTVIPTPNSQFSDYMVVQNISKEDAAKNKALREIPNYDKKELIQGVIIGNFKALPERDNKPTDEQKDDLPF